MNVNFDDFSKFSIPENMTKNDISEGDFVRLTYKKEKSAYYQIRMGFVDTVSFGPNGKLASLLLSDYTADPDTYLDEPGTRNLLVGRMGGVEVYNTTENNDMEEIVLQIPKGRTALLKIKDA